MKQTKEKRRLAIVNDASQQLKIGAYRTGNYGYVTLPKFLKKLKDTDPKAQAKKHLKEITPDKFCGVCAKGSLFLSVIRKENQCDMENLGDSFHDMKKILTRDGLFTEHNINLVEAYFENWNFSSYSTNSGWVLGSDGYCYGYGSGAGVGPYEKVKQLVEDHNEMRDKWIKQYRNRTDRLVAILENMKVNKGVFKPLKQKFEDE